RASREAPRSGASSTRSSTACASRQGGSRGEDQGRQAAGEARHPVARSGRQEREHAGQLREVGRAPAGRALDGGAFDRDQPRQARADRSADAEPLAPVSSVLSVGAPDVAFSVCAVTAAAGAAVPTISFGVRVDADGREVSSIALIVQLRLDATRRRYAPADETLLLELFGGRERWGQTLRSLL